MSALLCSLFLVTAAQNPSQPEAFMSWPDVHGDRVVFSAEGDLWLGNTKTMNATRLTSDIGVESQARFSPDGQQIAFVGNYDGFTAIYRMKVEGGSPEQLTFDQRPSTNVLGFDSEGKRLLISYPAANLFVQTLAWLDPTTKAVQPLPLEMASFSSLGPKSGQLAMTRVSQTWQAWFGYTGGQANPIWFGDTKTMQFKKVYQSKGSNDYPAVSGDRIYFCQDTNGAFAIRSIKTDGSDLKTISGPYPVPLQQLRCDSDHLVYMKGPGLESVDLKSGTIKPLNFHLSSDEPKSRPYYVPAEAWIQDMSIEPDAKRVTVESRGAITSIPLKDGAAKVVVSKPGVRFKLASVSPDKKKLAYVSDETGEEQIYVAEADGSNPVAWTKEVGRSISQLKWSPTNDVLAVSDSNFNISLLSKSGVRALDINRWAFTIVPLFDFSPDGKWLVTDSQNAISGFPKMILFDLAGKKSYPIDLGLIDATHPVFSSDGKWLAFLSTYGVAPADDPVLNEKVSNAKTVPFILALSKDTKSPFLSKSGEDEAPPKPGAKPDAKGAKPETKIDLEGLSNRLIRIPAPEAIYLEVHMAGDRVLLPTDSELQYYDVKEQKAGKICALSPFSVVDGWQTRVIEISSDGKSALVFGPSPRIVNISQDDQKPDAGKIQFGNLRIRVEPKHEWNQIYNESWRLIRDYFNAPNINGVNWDAIRAKYQPLVGLVRDRSDLTYIIRWLQSETNVGHMYTGGGDSRSSYHAQPLAFLGIDTLAEHGYLKITKILKGNGYIQPSPLAAPGLGVSEGDYLISVAGEDVHSTEDYARGLRGRSGKTVELVVNGKPTQVGARTILVAPISSESSLRSYEWMSNEREYVSKKSNGQLGYIHLNAMGDGDFADFIRQYFPQQDKSGLVIDIRYNGGGNLAGPLTEILARTVKMWGYLRNGGEFKGRDTDAYLGHMVCLVNEHSYSEGEGFPYYFRRAKLGPIIGKRTWGGYMGSWPAWPLNDRSTLSVSHYGSYNPNEGWVIEGEGVVPDIEVENEPSMFAKGIDSQLDKAIEVLLKDIKLHPINLPHHPPFPVKPLRGEGIKTKGHS